MKERANYVQLIERSEWRKQDQCYVGSAPGLLFGGCHGDDEKRVFNELCHIVEETILSYKVDGKPLLPPTSGHDYVNKLQSVA
jgi:hypothetical protein